jgi:hypothetical protein
MPGMHAAPSNTFSHILAQAIVGPAGGLHRRVRLLVVHCSATPSGQWLGGKPASAGYRGAADVIDGWHKARGFQRGGGARAAFNWRLAHIGYHYVVDLDGAVSFGRQVNEVGAHAAGFNHDTVGICMVGGAERQARYTAAQWQALAMLVRELCGGLGIPAAPALNARTDAGVCGHRDLSPDADGDGHVEPTEWLKTCPGFDVAAWLQRGMEATADQLIVQEA